MWSELQGKRIGIFDTEANGLRGEVTRVLCATVIDATTRERWDFNDEQCKNGELAAKLDEFDVLAGHNIIGYDLGMMFDVLGYKPSPNVILLDTLFMSRMYWPDMDGGHSLKAWGERIGEELKIEYYPILDPNQPHYDPTADPSIKGFDPGWTDAIYSDEMMDYCGQDVVVNVDVFWKLVDLLINFTFDSIMVEMATALIIQRQMDHGFVFDMRKAEMLHARLVERKIDLEEEVRDTFRPKAKLVREVQPKVKKDGTLSTVGLKKITDVHGLDAVPVPEFKRRVVVERELNEFTGDVEDMEYEVVEYQSGAFSLIEWVDFNLGSRKQIAERLLDTGYKLTKKTEKGAYIIDDAVLKEAADAGIPEAKPLADYFMVSKVEAMVVNWIDKAVWHEDQGVYRIHGYVNTLGANTNRMTHSQPNVAQVPAAKFDKEHNPIFGYESSYGSDCRELFTVRDGYVLIGCDADGLELRTLACYMKDPEYRDTILNGKKSEGTDIHNVNMRAAGLTNRDDAKTMILS